VMRRRRGNSDRDPTKHGRSMFPTNLRWSRIGRTTATARSLRRADGPCEDVLAGPDQHELYVWTRVHVASLSSLASEQS
jgi:hypothetical protein